MSKKKKKDYVRIYEVYEGEVKPSNLYINPETGMVEVFKNEDEKDG